MFRLMMLIICISQSAAWATNYELSTNNLGIGTALPKSTLGVGGNLSVGDATYTNVSPPTSGAIIEGNVGIGSPNPGQKLDVNGTVKATAFSGDGSALTNVPNGSQTPWLSNINGAGYSLANTGNIGVGTGLANYAIQVNGSGIGAEMLNKGYELIIPSPAGITGNDVEVGAFLVYKGFLYIGYRGEQGTQSARLYKWDGQTLTFLHSFGTGTHFQSVASMVEYQGNIYVGIEGAVAGDADVYVSTDDGVTWSKSYDNSADIFAWAMVNFKGKIYMGAGYLASRIYSFDGTSWTTSYAGKSGAGLVLWMEVYKGKLFAALGSSGGGGNSGIVSTSDGVTWTVEGNFSHTALYDQINFIKEFNGHLYATVSKGSSGTNDLLIRNDAAGTWSIIATGFSGSFCNPMNIYNNNFYLGCTVTGGGIVYKSYDGINYTVDFTNNYQGSKGTEPFRMVNFNGSLYIGFGFTSNTTADIWRKTDSLGQQSDNWGNILNKFRQFTENGYNWPNDTSSIAVSSPVKFDSIIRPSAGVNWVDLSGYASTKVLVGASDGSGSFQTVPASGSGSQIQYNNSGVLGGISGTTIDANGNIGLGSATPGQILDVTGTVRMTGFNLLTNPSSGYVLTSNSVGVGTWMPASAGGGGSGTVTSITAGSGLSGGAITTSGTIALDLTNANTWTGQQIFNTANVGVGSATPGQKLDVNGTIRATSFVAGAGAATLTGDSNGNIGVGSATPGQALDVAGTARATSFTGAGTGLTGTATSLSIGGNAATVTTNANLTGAVTSTGNATSSNFTANIGIGSATPGQALDVNGTVRATALSIVGGTSSQFLKGNGTTDSTVYCQQGGTNCPAGGTNPWIAGTGGNIGIATTSTVGIGTTFGNAGLTIMNGNVGIGTWIPTNGISIQGSGGESIGYTLGAGTNGLLVAGNVSIGTNINTANALSVQGSSTAIFSAINTAAVSAASGAGIQGYANTIPSASGQRLGFFILGANDSGTFRNTVGMQGFSDQAWTTGSAAGSYITLETTTNGGTSRSEKVRINNAGNLGVGTSLASGLLEVGNQKFDVLSGGNVGIGSITPGQILDVQGTVRVAKIGATISIVQGTNACAGTATLSSGAVTVSTTCTPSSANGFLLTDLGGGVLANIGSLSIGTVTASTSFVVNSSSALDSSNVYWEIHKPTS